jgi:hypothetical protein
LLVYVPGDNEEEARVTVIAAVPVPLVGETEMRLLPVPVLDAVHVSGEPAAVCVIARR